MMGELIISLEKIRLILQQYLLWNEEAAEGGDISIVSGAGLSDVLIVVVFSLWKYYLIAVDYEGNFINLIHAGGNNVQCLRDGDDIYVSVSRDGVNTITSYTHNLHHVLSFNNDIGGMISIHNGEVNCCHHSENAASIVTSLPDNKSITFGPEITMDGLYQVISDSSKYYLIYEPIRIVIIDRVTHKIYADIDRGHHLIKNARNVHVVDDIMLFSDGGKMYRLPL